MIFFNFRELPTLIRHRVGIFICRKIFPLSGLPQAVHELEVRSGPQ